MLPFQIIIIWFGRPVRFRTYINNTRLSLFKQWHQAFCQQKMPKMIYSKSHFESILAEFFLLESASGIIDQDIYAEKFTGKFTGSTAHALQIRRITFHNINILIPAL